MYIWVVQQAQPFGETAGFVILGKYSVFSNLAFLRYFS
jgi:hypothetical protein